MPSSRSETKELVENLLSATAVRPPSSNVFGQGPCLLSDIPAFSSKDGGIVLGIDEAGRGSVVGPMVYGMAFWQKDIQVPKDFNDSKQLTEEKRASLFQTILDTPQIGFCIRVLHASEISRNMLRAEPYNLNAMSHDAAIQMIRHLQQAGVSIEQCFIDTVGNPEHYKRRLEAEFPGVDFCVESKADAKYAPCSAASVVAKVVRDRIIQNFSFSEPVQATTDFGSGYPSDPVCKKWLEDHQNCKVFGFPDAVRFSWGPIKKALEANAIAVEFEADQDDDEDDVKKQQAQMRQFLGKQTKKRKRLPYFERKRLAIVTSL